MSNCQKLQEKLTNLQKSKDELQELLERYQQTGSEESKQNLTEALKDFSLENFDQVLKNSIKKMLTHHSHAEKFKDKITVDKGEVIVTDNLNFFDEKEFYLPTIIDRVKGSLDLTHLETVEQAGHLDLPDTVEGTLYLEGFRSADNFTLPDKIGGDLDLWNLKSAENLELPDTVKEDLVLYSLQSPDNLELHDGLKGDVFLDGLSKEDREELKEKYPKLADQITTSP